MTKNCFKTALIVAVSASVAITAGATSAKAFTIGGNVDFSTAGNVVTADFSNGTVVGVDTAFSAAGTPVTVADLPLTISSIISASNTAVPGFISGFQYQMQPAVFDLFSGSDTALISNALGTIAADLSFHGVIKSTTGNLLANVTGTFSGTESATNKDFSIDLAATPVPTPALLPGLLGMGMGIVRKRKQQS